MAAPEEAVAPGTSRLARDLRTIAGGGGMGFAELARKIGLNPRRDFRRACLDGTDLRGQDLRGFDFRQASFKGARIHGALFDPPLSQAQIRSAIRRGRAITLFVGHKLESAVGEFEAVLDASMVAPKLLNDALRRAGREREQHYGADGVFLPSDGQRLVSKLVAGPMRKEQAAVRDSGAAIIFFEPTTDFDFDILNVLHTRIERSGGRHLTFVFPADMPGDSGRKLFEVRARDAFRRPQDVIIFERGSDKPSAQRAALDANARALQHVVEWLAVLDRSRRLAAESSPRFEMESFSQLYTGLVPPRGSLVTALRTTLQAKDAWGAYRARASRRLYLPSTLAADVEVPLLREVLGNVVGSDVSIDVFKAEPTPGAAQRFFILEAARTSSAWHLVDVASSS